MPGLPPFAELLIVASAAAAGIAADVGRTCEKFLTGRETRPLPQELNGLVDVLGEMRPIGCWRRRLRRYQADEADRRKACQS